RAAAADAGRGRSSTMMHCTMDDLLALKDHAASAWATRHVAECPVCRAELDALYQRIAALKALPVRGPARDRWPAVRDAVRAGERRRRGRWGAWTLAAAAGIALLLLVRPSGGGAGRGDAAELERMKQQSATLEAELERYDPAARGTSC